MNTHVHTITVVINTKMIFWLMYVKMMGMVLNLSPTLYSSQQSKGESKPGPELISLMVCISVTIVDYVNMMLLCLYSHLANQIFCSLRNMTGISDVNLNV